VIDDPLIDDVAKAMTSEPSDGRLAERVAARIAEAPAPRRWFAQPWVLAPVAAACVLVIAVVVLREKPAPQQNVRLKPDATNVLSDVTIARATPEPRAASPEGRAPSSEPRVASRVPIDLPALTVEPIEVDRLVVQPLVETNAIQIAPIAIDRIEISPMP
jgi:hypothetical protein